MSVKEHKKYAPNIVNLGVVSISTTRSLNNDESGHWIVEAAKEKGHIVLIHDVVEDEKKKIRKKVLRIIAEEAIDVLLLTGGTGITNKDVTIEALSSLFSKTMPGFASLFTFLSYKVIGSSSLISRARAGIIQNTAIFCMPGSKKACILACEKLIFPEIGHIMLHLKDK